MRTDYSHLPLLLEAVAERVGEAGALRLVERLGGRMISVPLNAGGSKLARQVGEETAAVIVEMHGGDKVYIPNMTNSRATERRRYILTNPGLSPNDCASQLGVSERWVRKVRKARGGKQADLAQGCLFGD